jgi:LPS sulfotransferase NodH
VTTNAPIFVVGYQRSGTTLLQSLLGAHPRIAAPPETFFIFRVVGLAGYFGDLNDDDALRLALREALNPPVPMFADCGFDEVRLFERARRAERTYASLFDVIMTDFADRHGKQRWSEKTPGQPARGVFELFPDAQVVHIVRDPRDVVASSLETPWTPPRTRLVAENWRQFTLDNARVGLDVGPRRFLQIRYEDLTSDPESVLGLVCTFLGEEFAPQMLDDPSLRAATVPAVAAEWQKRALDTVTSSRQGRWRKMSRRDQVQTCSVVRRELPALGYGTVDRTTAALGAVVNAVMRPTELRDVTERLRLRVARRDPSRYYREIQRYMRRRASTVTNEA